MSAELRRLGQDLIDRGYITGGMIIRAQAPILEEAGLIPAQLEENGNGPLARGRKLGPTTFDIDPSRLKEMRLASDLSQRSLANQSGLSLSFISTIERGKHTSISGSSARRLAGSLGVELDQLKRREVEENER